MDNIKNKKVYVVTKSTPYPDYKRPSVSFDILGVYNDKDLAEERCIKHKKNMILEYLYFLNYEDYEDFLNECSDDYSDEDAEYLVNIINSVIKKNLTYRQMIIYIYGLDITKDEGTINDIIKGLSDHILSEYYMDNPLDVSVEEVEYHI